MTGESPFEELFPQVFAASVRELLDDLPLAALLDRLAVRMSERAAPLSMTVRRHEGDTTGTVTASSTDSARDIVDPAGSVWGTLVVAGPPSGHDGRPEVAPTWLEATAAFASWLVDRHAARRRRLGMVDRERQLIAGQLHDDSIQAMTAISLNLQRLARAAPMARDEVERLLHLTNDAIDRLRHMMFALHPPTLADDGLVPTLEDYLDTFIAPSGVTVAVHGDPVRRSTPEAEALAFRLARGAVHNSWKHARAASIGVTVTVEDGAVSVVVRDDGVGFDPAPDGHPGTGHVGIAYSRDLATEVGGRYEITSAPGAGTTVTIVVPAG